MSLLPYEEAISLFQEQIPSYERIEKIALTQCLDRILAEDIKALQNYPFYPTASMDGYALRYEEQDKPLKIIDILKAGELKERYVKDKECIKTFTGALISKGLDTLVPIENVRVEGDLLFIEKKVPKGFALRQVGESYKKGELVLKKGTRLSFSEIALLGELGFFHISVFIQPVIGILSSGNELKDLGEALENPAQIRSSNHLALAMLAQKYGARAIIFPLLKDEESLISQSFQKALKSCDILVSSGGVSVGDYDFIKTELRKNYELIIDKVDIKPGRHIKIAKKDEKFIMALPGFPYSAMVTFSLFVGQLLNTWLLQSTKCVQAFFKGRYEKKSEYLEFLACKIEYEKGKIYASLKDKKQGSSAIISNLNYESVLMKVPKDKLVIEENELVELLFI